MQDATPCRQVAKVTILIPNYRTPQLTKLCVRLLRKHTDFDHAKIIVIDNNSGDESVAYLRTLPWIQLLERRGDSGESGALSHSRALDLALQQVDTPFVLSIHTDTLVRHPNYLQFLLARIEEDENIAGVGSWKLERKSMVKRIAKSLEYSAQSLFYALIGRKDHALEGQGDNHYYLRSHCALYRTELLRKYDLGFSDEGEVAGKAMHRKLLQQGYRMVFLPSAELLRYIEHVGHATSVLNPEFRSRKSKWKGQRRVRKALRRFEADRVLADSSLDA